MRKFRAFWRRWYVQLLIILIPFALGLVGYIFKYNSADDRKMIDMAVYSTIRLFGFMFDAKPGFAWYDYVLAAARWLAIIPTGNVLIRLLQPFTARFFSEMGFRFWKHRAKTLLVFGADEDSRHVYDTSEGYSPMIRCSSDNDFKQLRGDGYSCVQMTAEAAMTAAVTGAFSVPGRERRIVIHEQDQELNLHLCRIAVREIRKVMEEPISRLEEMKKEEGRNPEEIRRLEQDIVRRLEQIRIVVFGDKNLESAYLDMVRQSYGVLRYTNKYRMIAVELVEKYPLVRFMDRKKHMDEAGMVSKNLEMNVIMVGFGDTNQEIFTTSMMVNQFVTAGNEGIPEHKTVYYHIYDRENVETNKNLNHMAFRFEHEFCGAIRSHMIRKEDYLPLPDDPANDTFYQTDINDQQFYEQIWRITTAQAGSVNVIVIAHGNDLENIDLAQKMRTKVREWNIGNIHLFVRIRKAENAELVRNIPSGELIVFGDERKASEMQRIFSDELEDMARQKHYMNALIHSRSVELCDKDADDIRLHSLYEWHTYDPLKKKSSIYSILSIRSKLLMMGLDYRKKAGNRPHLENNDEYFRIYAKDDAPKTDRVIDSLKGMEIYDYRQIMEKDDFRRHTLRRTLAVQEHCRWNAFMICNGFVPATKEQLRAGKVQDYDLRFHGSLTTFSGLFDYRRLMTEANGEPEIMNDKINYDFHLMDDVWWYLDMFEYEVIRA